MSINKNELKTYVGKTYICAIDCYSISHHFLIGDYNVVRSFKVASTPHK